MNLKFEESPVDFKGWYTKRDPSKLAKGFAATGQNVVITDGDLIAPRAGSELFGAEGSSSKILSTHVFKKRDGTEIALRNYSSYLEFYNHLSGNWENLTSGLTAARMGFADHNINTDSIDLVYFCNSYEPLMRWEGEYSLLNGALAGTGETTITVDSTLKDMVYYSGVVSSGNATSITVANNDFSTDLWNSFYVYITSGSHIGKVRKISATTANQITFTTLGSTVTAADTFEIRLLKFEIPDSGSKTLRIGHTTPFDIEYTNIPTSTTITCVANTTAVADNSSICTTVTKYPNAPRCNKLVVLHTRMFGIGNLKSPSSLYYSKIAEANDWSFSSPRTEGEGGVIDFPEGGGAITGLDIHEDKLYVLKRDLIKTVDFTQGQSAGLNDIPIINPLIESPNIGPLVSTAVFKAKNDILFISAKGGLISISRIISQDTIPQTTDVADPIRPSMNLGLHDNAVGKIFDDKVYIATKETTSSTYNDIIFVYNTAKKIWDLPIKGWNSSDFFIYYNNLYYSSSINNTTFKCNTGVTDNLTSYLCNWTSGDENYQKPATRKTFDAFFVEGYIGESTTLKVRVNLGYLGGIKTIETELNGTDPDYILDPVSDNLLGIQAISLWPLASTDEISRELKKFRVYLTTTNCPFYEYSVEFESDGEGQIWQILNYGPNITADTQLDIKLKKAFK